MKKLTDFVLDRDTGEAVVGAEVYVRKQSDNTLASLFSDDGVTATTNPLTTDTDGEFSFYAADDTYKIQIYWSGVQQNEINNYQHLDLDSAASPQFTAVNIGHATDTTVARASAGDISVEGNIVYRAGGTDVPLADGGTGASTAAAARTNLGLGTIATFDETTAAQIRNNTADKAVSTDQMWAAAAFVALTPGANVAVDLNSGINFTLAMAGNYTLDNPTNGKAGQQGLIEITQDATGSRTLAYGTNWKFAGGTDPTLSTTASAKDLLYYEVLSDGSSVYGSLVQAIA